MVLFSLSFQTRVLPLMLTTHFLSYLLQRDHCCSCYWKSKNTSLPANHRTFPREDGSGVFDRANILQDFSYKNMSDYYFLELLLFVI